MRTPSGAIARVKATVAEVHKMLISVGAMVDAGNEVFFGQQRSFVRNLRTGVETEIVRERGVYVMELQVLKPNASSGGSLLATLENESKCRLSGGKRQ